MSTGPFQPNHRNAQPPSRGALRTGTSTRPPRTTHFSDNPTGGSVGPGSSGYLSNNSNNSQYLFNQPSTNPSTSQQQSMQYAPGWSSPGGSSIPTGRTWDNPYQSQYSQFQYPQPQYPQSQYSQPPPFSQTLNSWNQSHQPPTAQGLFSPVPQYQPSAPPSYLPPSSTNDTQSMNGSTGSTYITTERSGPNGTTTTSRTIQGPGSISQRASQWGAHVPEAPKEKRSFFDRIRHPFGGSNSSNSNTPMTPAALAEQMQKEDDRVLREGSVPMSEAMRLQQEIDSLKANQDQSYWNGSNQSYNGTGSNPGTFSNPDMFSQYQSTLPNPSSQSTLSNPSYAQPGMQSSQQGGMHSGQSYETVNGIPGMTVELTEKGFKAGFDTRILNSGYTYTQVIQDVNNPDERHYVFKITVTDASGPSEIVLNRGGVGLSPSGPTSTMSQPMYNSNPNSTYSNMGIFHDQRPLTRDRSRFGPSEVAQKWEDLRNNHNVMDDPSRIQMMEQVLSQRGMIEDVDSMCGDLSKQSEHEVRHLRELWNENLKDAFNWRNPTEQAIMSSYAAHSAHMGFKDQYQIAQDVKTLAEQRGNTFIEQTGTGTSRYGTGADEFTITTNIARKKLQDWFNALPAVQKAKLTTFDSTNLENNHEFHQGKFLKFKNMSMDGTDLLAGLGDDNLPARQGRELLFQSIFEQITNSRIVPTDEKSKAKLVGFASYCATMELLQDPNHPSTYLLRNTRDDEMDKIGWRRKDGSQWSWNPLSYIWG